MTVDYHDEAAGEEGADASRAISLAAQHRVPSPYLGTPMPKDLDEQIKALEREIRQTGNMPDKLALQRQARTLEAKREEAWRAYDAAAKEIEVQKDGFLDQVEGRLKQSLTDEELFAIRFQVR